jgi:hypothetical protein
MRSFSFLVVCLTAFLAVSPIARAEENPLVGTWRADNVVGSDGSTLGIATFIFTADGRYAFIANGQGPRGPFTFRTEGRYQIVGSGQTTWVMDSYLICNDAAATSCQPYPNPEIGLRQQGSFQMDGPNKLIILGSVWRRLS